MEQSLNHESQNNSLRYEPIQTQGQCILLSITPIRFLKPLYFLYIFFSVAFAGIPIVFAYWYPQLKLFFYYKKCSLSQCTHFYIMNYDLQITIAEKQVEPHDNFNVGLSAQQLGSSDMNSNKNKNHAENSVFFMNRYMKYNVEDGLVTASLFNYRKHIRRQIRKSSSKSYRKSSQENNQIPIQGLEESAVQQLRNRYGIGTMKIQCPSIAILFLREIVRPLYFFIIASMIIWLFDDYYVYCGVIFITAAFGIIINLYQTYALNKKIHSMAYYETQVKVLRGKQVKQISSIDIVPGDIVFLKGQMKIPFDAIILEGSALLNECALTGQSVPVIKKADSIEDLENGNIELKNCLICQGTLLIQANNKNKMHFFQQFREQHGIPVSVIRTNFVTVKGQLIRIISFPQQKTNIFHKQSSWFLIFLFCLSVTSYSFLAIKFVGKIQISDMVLKFFDLITTTVPPGLPVSMTFGIIFAIDKMKKKDIFCVSPSKVIAGGLVNFLCFDKTGTLTEDYMDFECLVPCNAKQFKEPINNFKVQQQLSTLSANNQISKNIKQNPQIIPALCNMATNHSIVKIQATGQNVGDPMQIKLFQFGCFKVVDIQNKMKKMKEDDQDAKQRQSIFSFRSQWGYQGQVYQRFDFDSELLRMSTIAVTQKADEIHKNQRQFQLYCKGSPQAMLKIFNKKSVPENFHEILREYTSQGFRVLAIGHRYIKNIDLSRLQLEQDLVFDGFQIFQNKLKPETKAAIKQLNQAQLPCVMITGDNALTGSNIAYKCRIADFQKKMFIYDYDEKQQKIICDQFQYQPNVEQLDEDQIIQERQQHNKNKEIQMTMLPKKEVSYLDGEYIEGGNKNQLANGKYSAVDQDVKKILANLEVNDGQICITGNGFNYLFQGNLDQQTPEKRKLLQQIKVFSRAKPNDKARIIMAYQSVGKKVSMCGDGANDCGALKQADIGLSLSQAQASISAPFTSKVVNISSMIQLIKQCQAGLVTNFSLFDIMALYSFIQYSSDMILQFMYTYPSDYQFVYWDLFGNFFFFMTFGYTGTAEKLTKHKPSHSLLSLTNLIQLIVMFITQLLGQLLMIYSLAHIFADDIDYDKTGGEDRNYQKYIDAGNQFVKDTPETNIIFLFTNFLYIFTFLAFSISRPWRKQFYTNKPFLAVLIIVFVFSSVLVVVPQARLGIFQLSYLTYPPLNLFILLTGYIFSGVILFNQKCILQPISARLRDKYPSNQWI